MVTGIWQSNEVSRKLQDINYMKWNKSKSRKKEMDSYWPISNFGSLHEYIPDFGHWEYAELQILYIPDMLRYVATV